MGEKSKFTISKVHVVNFVFTPCIQLIQHLEHDNCLKIDVHTEKLTALYVLYKLLPWYLKQIISL